MSRGAAIPRVAALDGLRGAAVAGVLLFHGGHLVGGYLGVDLFFVLSGFLITSLLLVESDRSGKIALGGFWARRARRLLPALVGLMIGVGVYCIVFAQPAELAGIRGDGIATVFYVANWRAVFAHQDYWALFNAPSPFQHTWSLAIEEQFYLVWPLVFVGVLAWWKRAAPRALLVVCLIGVAVSTVLMAMLYDSANVARVYYGTDTRASGILLGAAFATALVIWGPIRGRRGRIVLEAAGIGGIAILCYAWTHVDGQSAFLYRGGFLVFGAAVVAVIAAASHPDAGLISRLLSWRPLCMLGLISYGVYLWHWPVYVVLDPARTGVSGWSLLAIRVLVTLGIATASYVILEQPIRHGALSPRSWRWLTPAVATGVVVVVLSSTMGAKPAETASPTRSDAVRAAVTAAKANPAARRVLVVGNSVGYKIATALQVGVSRPPVVVLNGALVGCAFPWGAMRPSAIGQLPPSIPCDSAWAADVHQFQPDVVMVVLQCCASEYRFGTKWMQPCDRAYAPLFRRKMGHAIDILRADGAQVVITTAPYTIKEQNSSDARHNIDCTNDLRRAIAHAKLAKIVDLFRWTCPQAPRCLAERDGVTLRPDGVHFEGASALLAGQWILRQAGFL